MPQCVLADQCQYPGLALRSGHKCRRCRHVVHVLCAEEDPLADTTDNLTCFLCATPPKFAQQTANNLNATHPPSEPYNNHAASEPYNNHAAHPLPITEHIDVLPKQRLSTSKGKCTQSKRKSPPTYPKRRTKYSKEFRLDADNSKPDPLLMKPVAFDVDDNLYGSQLYKHFGGEELAKKYLASRNGKRVLLGTVIRTSNKKTKSSSSIHYDVQWEESDLGDTSIDLSVVIDAIALHQAMFVTQSRVPNTRKRKALSRDPFSPELRNVLLSVEESERGQPEMSEDDETDETDDDNMFNDGEMVFHHHMIYEKITRPQSPPNDNANDESGNGLDFRWTTGNLPPPPDRSKRRTSHVKPSLTGHFETPISSLLAFIPLKIFNSIALYSNQYANHIMETTGSGNVAGKKWEGDITINEIMQFFGILFKMVLRPTPGQSYPSCWSDTQWHPYTMYMKLRRFQQIRSVLHFNDNSTIDGSNDAAFKVRPLLNCVKLTFPQYLELGDEVALDEASVSCRSRYGGDVIFYNPRKPNAKFHFRFYMLCDSSSYACVRIRMHTRNKTDLADAPASPTFITRAGLKTTGLGTNMSIPRNDAIDDPKRKRLFVDMNKNDTHEDDDACDEQDAVDLDATDTSQDKKSSSTLLSLIMDMCQPLFGSGRVVNMDNYYTSPMAAWMLSQEKVYMRGTCRTNRIGFPNGVCFSSREKNNLQRGSIKTMIERKRRIAAFGWMDGNPVHFLSTADGNATTTVCRRVGRQSKTVEAPIGIRNYNEGMQAVDRHDQLRERFSLSSRHGFKKYYQKIALGLIDMAVVNAWIHYKLVNPDKCSNEKARYEFMDTLANSLLQINWQEYYHNQTPGDNNNDILRLLTHDKRTDRARNINDHEIGGDTGILVRCAPIAVQRLMSERSKKKGFSCQVCSFEGRGTNIIRNVVVCGRHRIRACMVAREDRNLKHADGSDVVDYSWRAPMPGTSCWEKMHEFYIPKGLFKDFGEPTTQPFESVSPPHERMIFQCCSVGSTLYKKKKDALGETVVRRGRRKKTQNDQGSEEEYTDAKAAIT